jgi:hypothetical protein
VARQRRGFYRIEYPPPERPKILIAGRTYRVIDLSEKGVRFLCDELFTPKEGEQVRAKITFRENDSVDVAGVVLRKSLEQCALKLNQVSIPLKKVMAEQRYLLAKYKTLIGRDR